MNMKRFPRVLLGTLVLFALAGGAAVPLVADEGRIPIFQQTTITQSGHYVVTRSFSVSSGSAILIDADKVTRLQRAGGYHLAPERIRSSHLRASLMSTAGKRLSTT